MNFFTSTHVFPWAKNITLFVVRLFVGFAMISHGYPKLEKLMSGEEVQFFDFIGLGPHTTLILAVFAEFVCAIFLILGLFTKWAAFFLAFTMIIAVTMVHGSDPFAEMEKGLLFLSLFLIFLVFGPGKYSIDQMIEAKRNTFRY